MGIPMGLNFGLNRDDAFCKRKFRFLFRVDGIISDLNRSTKTLPHSMSSRPNLSFKETEAKHLIENVYFPAKPDWKPINVVLYDLKLGENHPVWDWIKEFYDPRKGQLFVPNANPLPTEGFIRNVALDLYDGCGNLAESWIYEDAWPSSINFQTLEMGSSELMTVDLTIRYARAYFQEKN